MTMEAAALLEADSLSFGYGRKILAKHLSVTLGAGTITSLIGSNGVGKTTLFRTLLGLTPPLAGRVLLQGDRLTALRRPVIARRMALVPQAEPGVFSFAALDLVLMGRTARLGPFATPSAADREIAMAALERLGIADLAPRDVSRLSGGQRQLVLIARALAQEAPVLLLDEPTASLDLANAWRVLQTVEALAADGKAVLLSTHDPAHALHLGGQAVALHREGMVAVGPVADVVTGALLSRLYGMPLTVEQVSSGKHVVLPSR